LICKKNIEKVANMVILLCHRGGSDAIGSSRDSWNIGNGYIIFLGGRFLIAKMEN